MIAFSVAGKFAESENFELIPRDNGTEFAKHKNKRILVPNDKIFFSFTRLPSPKR
jgi:hypothetical protein